MRPEIYTNIVETFIGAEGIEFHVVEYDKSMRGDLEKFCASCEVENNSEVKKLKMGKWGKYEKWWVVYHNNNIVSMAGALRYPHLSENTFNLLYRLATLPSYRNMAYPNFSRYMLHEFGLSRIMPHQIEWAKSMGADDCIVTFNSPEEIDTTTGHKFYELARKVLNSKKHIKGCFTLIEKDIRLYGIKQDVWKINIKSLHTMEKIDD